MSRESITVNDGDETATDFGSDYLCDECSTEEMDVYHTPWDVLEARKGLDCE